MAAVWYYLHRMDGSVIASTTMLSDRWSWISECFAEDRGCSPGDVDCIETDAGDMVCIGGEIVGYLHVEQIASNLKGVA